jgi:hypothetical protein
LVIGGALVLYQTLKKARGRCWRRWLLPTFIVPVLLLYLVAALESRASPHWSMLGWILLIPLLGRWLDERWSESKALRWLTYGSAAYSLLIVVVLLAVMVPVGQWRDYQHPLRAIAGWQEAANLGDELRRALDRSEQSTEPVLLARNWHHAGLLAWYVPDSTVKNLFQDLNPHNFRQGVADHSTWGILVYPRKSDEPRLTDLTRDFDCTPFEQLAVEYGDSLLQTFHYYECYSKLPQPES